MENSQVGNYIAYAVIILFFTALTLLTLRSLLMGWLLLWSPLAMLWRKIRGVSSTDDR